MRGSWIFVVVFLFVEGALGRRIHKTLAWSSLAPNPKTIYLTKFDIGAGFGNISIKYK